MPKGISDERIDERVQTLLPPHLWKTTATPTATRSFTTNGIPNPFKNEKLQELWNQALENDAQYAEIRKAVEENAWKFPTELELQVSISECDINHGLLRHRERIWVPEYEPLRTQIM